MKVLDYNHEKQSNLYHGKNIWIPYPLGLIIPLLFFYKGGFSFQQFKKFYLLSNQIKQYTLFCSLLQTWSGHYVIYQK